jgi:hypothetical protein
MGKFRKKPVVIEAIKFKGSSTHVNAIKRWMETGKYIEPGMTTSDIRFMEINTLEGTMKVSPGDYIIKGVDGEFYPCRSDIFEKTYEPID